MSKDAIDDRYEKINRQLGGYLRYQSKFATERAERGAARRQVFLDYVANRKCKICGKKGISARFKAPYCRTCWPEAKRQWQQSKVDAANALLAVARRKKEIAAEQRKQRTR